jgi:phosphoenolpyruvate carboxylase
LTRVFRLLMRDYLDLDQGLRRHRRAQRERGVDPIVIDPATRDNMNLLNAVRLACMLRLFALAAHIPDFSGRYELTRDELVTNVLHLDIDRVVAVLRRIFPYERAAGPTLDWGEAATYLDAEGESYRREHETIFTPMADTAERIRRISVAVVHHLGAFG